MGLPPLLRTCADRGAPRDASGCIVAVGKGNVKEQRRVAASPTPSTRNGLRPAHPLVELEPEWAPSALATRSSVLGARSTKLRLNTAGSRFSAARSDA